MALTPISLMAAKNLDDYVHLNRIISAPIIKKKNQTLFSLYHHPLERVRKPGEFSRSVPDIRNEGHLRSLPISDAMKIHQRKTSARRRLMSGIFRITCSSRVTPERL